MMKSLTADSIAWLVAVAMLATATCRGEDVESNWRMLQDLDANFREGCRATQFYFVSKNSNYGAKTLEDARKRDFRKDAIHGTGLLLFDGTKSYARLKWEPTQIIYDEQTSSVQDGPTDAVSFDDKVAVFNPSMVLTPTKSTRPQMQIWNSKQEFQNAVWAFLNPLEVCCYHDATFLPWLQPGWDGGEEFPVEIRPGDGVIDLITHDASMKATRTLTLSTDGKFPLIIKRKLEFPWNGEQYLSEEFVEVRKSDDNLLLPVSVHSFGKRTRQEGYSVKQWRGEMRKFDDAMFQMPVDPNTSISQGSTTGFPTLTAAIKENGGKFDLMEMETLTLYDRTADAPPQSNDGFGLDPSSNESAGWLPSGSSLFSVLFIVFVLIAISALVVAIRIRYSKKHLES